MAKRTQSSPSTATARKAAHHHAPPPTLHTAWHRPRGAIHQIRQKRHLLVLRGAGAVPAGRGGADGARELAVGRPPLLVQEPESCVQFAEPEPLAQGVAGRTVAHRERGAAADDPDAARAGSDAGHGYAEGEVSALKEFEYEHVANDLTDDDQSAVDPFIDSDALAECLETQQESLEWVRVRDAVARDWSFVSEMMCGHDSSDEVAREKKTGFKKLDTLDVGPLRCEWPKLYGDLRSVATRLTSSLPPVLKTFKVKACPFDNQEFERLLRTLAWTLAAERRPLKTVKVVD
ncbi:hypothetical protein OPT61_g8028 [Boeremia exigua]|uniref:Uncharacterized protein n=1 Tax=Boeremia exigua TaxID=749465 RepID=A0ACC2I0G9_9PLEO|nr:hypothetical protein OPT61_g8028 [Boeremia exigua]